ncbi:MAG: hypothetical protein RBU30_14865 [Polyangia bacterium]|jgi:hypothetical protein|nr:hypothetical protein [Polyangia bacterium]
MSLFSITDIAVPTFEPRKRTRARRKQGRSTPGTEGDVPVRVQRVAALLPMELHPGQSLHLVSAGEWSNYDLIESLLRYFPEPPALYLATWSSSDSAVRQLARLRTEGRVSALHSIMDHHAAQQRTDGAAYLQGVSDTYGTTGIHAKVAVLISSTVGITVIGSANLTTNPRIEAGVITHDLTVARFHAQWITDAITQGGLFDATQAR